MSLVVPSVSIYHRVVQDHVLQIFRLCSYHPTPSQKGAGWFLPIVFFAGDTQSLKDFEMDATIYCLMRKLQ